MTDLELTEQFEDGTLPIENFHHEEHVRVAFLYLAKYRMLDAVGRFSTALTRFAARNGKAGLYHETITWAYMLLIRERMARAGREQSWAEFRASNWDLLDRERRILKRYYREETLVSELARDTFVLPDRILEGISAER
jgi:hypothetical protein